MSGTSMYPEFCLLRVQDGPQKAADNKYGTFKSEGNRYSPCFLFDKVLPFLTCVTVCVQPICCDACKMCSWPQFLVAVFLIDASAGSSVIQTCDPNGAMHLTLAWWRTAQHANQVSSLSLALHTAGME
jgi:hypothetical protein